MLLKLPGRYKKFPGSLRSPVINLFSISFCILKLWENCIFWFDFLVLFEKFPGSLRSPVNIDFNILFCHFYVGVGGNESQDP